MGKSIDAMVLSGLALAFSRLIDDSVVVIENVYRHLEMGEEPAVAAVKGANEVALAVLAIMLVAVVVFFPVTFLFGVSKYLFTRAGAGRGARVVCFLLRRGDGRAAVLREFPEGRPRTCGTAHEAAKQSWGARFHAGFNAKFEVMLNFYERWVRRALDRPWQVVVGFLIFFCALLPADSVRRLVLFPANRRRPVRDQRQGAHGHAHRADRRLREARGRHRAAGGAARANWKRSFPISA